jgi:hypothetical protein
MLAKKIGDGLLYLSKAITPQTVTQMAKELGVNVDKLTKANPAQIAKLLKKMKIKMGNTKKTFLGGAAAGAAGLKGAQMTNDAIGDEKEKIRAANMNKGGVVKKKSYKNGGVVIIDKSGSSHYKSKGNSKAIAKKYFKGTF